MTNRYLALFICLLFFLVSCTSTVYRTRSVPYQDWEYVEEIVYVPEEVTVEVPPDFDLRQKNATILSFDDPVCGNYPGVGESISHDIRRRVYNFTNIVKDSVDICYIGGRVLTMQGSFVTVSVNISDVYSMESIIWSRTFLGSYDKVLEDIVFSFAPQKTTKTEMVRKTVTKQQPITSYREEKYATKQYSAGKTILLILILLLLGGGASGGGN